MRYIMIILLSAIFFIFGLPEFTGFALGLTHHFFHGNILHLAVNCFSIWFVFQRWTFKELVTAYVVATIAFFYSPVVSIGFSNIIFATIGLRTPSFSSKWWRHPNTITFFAVTLLMFVLPHVSALTHVVSLGLGVLVAMVRRQFKQVSNDSKRYTDSL